jgi:hypothetical protein
MSVATVAGRLTDLSRPREALLMRWPLMRVAQVLTDQNADQRAALAAAIEMLKRDADSWRCCQSRRRCRSIAIVSAAHNLLASGGALGDLGTHRFQS